MTGFYYNGYVYRYYWDENKYTKQARRKNGVERDISENEYNSMKDAFNENAMKIRGIQ